ncbi:hypothetical protein [Actinoplanes sp. NPDC020271]|uniref:hypothetical protein n=1 Tax=Actinoplanes sp. NPDC020271 TaxID=3363896 RepID=UPI0037B249AB
MSWKRSTSPLLWAPRGMADDPGGLHRADQRDDPGGLHRADQLDGADAELVPDVAHYTILLGSGSGAGRAADRIVALVSVSRLWPRERLPSPAPAALARGQAVSG